LKFRAVTAVQVLPLSASESVIGVLLIRYEKTSVWAAALPPFRHCSPVYVIMRFVTASEVSF